MWSMLVFDLGSKRGGFLLIWNGFLALMTRESHDIMGKRYSGLLACSSYDCFSFFLIFSLDRSEGQRWRICVMLVSFMLSSNNDMTTTSSTAVPSLYEYT